LAAGNHAVVARVGWEAVEIFIAKIDCDFGSPFATAVPVIIRDTILLFLNEQAPLSTHNASPVGLCLTPFGPLIEARPATVRKISEPARCFGAGLSV
jgi:hypothetical protein